MDRFTFAHSSAVGERSCRCPQSRHPAAVAFRCASAVLEAGLGSGVSVAPLAVLFDNPGKTIASAFGNGTCLDSAKLTAFLQSTASTIGLPAGPGLTLPGGLQLTASGANPVELKLSTTAPIAGVADLQLAAQIDCVRHVTPSGTVTLHLELPGSWSATAITFGVGSSGVTLSITPSTGSPIQILPSFSGLGTLAGTAKALLPAALNSLVDAIGPSPLRDDALALAQAFDLYDPVGKFDQHADQLRALTQGDWATAVSAAMRTTAIPALSAVLSHVAGTVADRRARDVRAAELRQSGEVEDEEAAGEPGAEAEAEGAEQDGGDRTVHEAIMPAGRSAGTLARTIRGRDAGV